MARSPKRPWKRRAGNCGRLQLPDFPTTTIGFHPQMAAIRAAHPLDRRHGEITAKNQRHASARQLMGEAGLRFEDAGRGGNASGVAE
ncbi:hypothetical protein [Janthinobacterium sp. UMAB-56]|uniref:hypothetical protein n=1 Tax=Janthinobacterium sp. UMAB-56 TaxID=1365361 RepID=UPI001C5672D1|nr:hypothetical protein [Janthinobacterium sp. UMAB-56]